MADYYANTYRLDYQLALRTPPRFHRIRSTREARDRLNHLAPILKPGARILDFGSGSGEFLAQARAAGYDAVGIEPGRSYAHYSRTTYGVTVIERALSDVELPAGRFDVVTANHVIEHLRNPVAALRTLAACLADDGVMYVAVPDVTGRSGYSFERFHFAHVYNFSPRTLVWAGLAAGLELDPRIEAKGTSLVFRKRLGGAVTEPWEPQQGVMVAARFQEGSPVRFLLRGLWIKNAVRRWRKALFDGLAER